MALLRTDRSTLCVQLSPEEAGRFMDSRFTRSVIRGALTKKARNGETVEILAPEGWPLDRFTVLQTEAGAKTVERSGKTLAVFLD